VVLHAYFMYLIRLGDSGLFISKVILGTASYGSSRWQPWVLEEEDALPLLEHAFNVGINTWDTVRLSLKFYNGSRNFRPRRIWICASCTDEKKTRPMHTQTVARKRLSGRLCLNTRFLVSGWSS
jgi:hypothetical protein